MCIRDRIQYLNIDPKKYIEKCIDYGVNIDKAGQDILEQTLKSTNITKIQYEKSLNYYMQNPQYAQEFVKLEEAQSKQLQQTKGDQEIDQQKLIDVMTFANSQLDTEIESIDPTQFSDPRQVAYLTLIIRTKIFDLVYEKFGLHEDATLNSCLLYTSPSPRDRQKSRMPSSA
eukprot:TRINITY_DN13286_c0_g1_i1.p2 TRINITY_DN13286_c0_g1~~TRINITY_DN13286_c0_g1_i1.p2  ORF type:complete len:172 (+),score=37.06 TRINITY_DN13286_c0_g1_i1:64-579(+)